MQPLCLWCSLEGTLQHGGPQAAQNMHGVQEWGSEVVESSPASARDLQCDFEPAPEIPLMNWGP